MEAQGDYLLSVKGNQQVLLDDIIEAFTDGKIEDEYVEKEVGHGRVESRTTRCNYRSKLDMQQRRLEEISLHNNGIGYTL